jgi:hypothetical protein
MDAMHLIVEAAELFTSFLNSGAFAWYGYGGCGLSMAKKKDGYVARRVVSLLVGDETGTCTAKLPAGPS